MKSENLEAILAAAADLEERDSALAAYSNNRSGVRCAETTRTSWAMPSAVRVSSATLRVSQSEGDPIMMPTSGFTAVL